MRRLRWWRHVSGCTVSGPCFGLLLAFLPGCTSATPSNGEACHLSITIPDRYPVSIDDPAISLGGIPSGEIALMDPETGGGMRVERVQGLQEDAEPSCVVVRSETGDTFRGFPLMTGMLGAAWSTVWEEKPGGTLWVPPGRYRLVVTYRKAGGSESDPVCRCSSTPFLIERGLSFVSMD